MAGTGRRVQRIPPVTRSRLMTDLSGLSRMTQLVRHC